jgi:DNA-binding response OmpR family regulator
MKVLLLEDHPIIRDNIVKLLKSRLITADSASHWEEGVLKLSHWSYDVIILDINMPIMNGKDFLKKIRKKGIMTPVLALSSNNMIWDKVEMFQLGVDDYLTKPFEFEELYMRLKAINNRKNDIIDETISIWSVEVNISLHKTYLNWEEKVFQNKQQKIIEYLIENKWYPKSKLSIMEYIWWEKEDTLNFNTVVLESHLSIIRKQLWKDFIKTIRWIWYLIP